MEGFVSGGFGGLNNLDTRWCAHLEEGPAIEAYYRASRHKGDVTVGDTALLCDTTTLQCGLARM